MLQVVKIDSLILYPIELIGDLSINEIYLASIGSIVMKKMLKDSDMAFLSSVTVQMIQQHFKAVAFFS